MLEIKNTVHMGQKVEIILTNGLEDFKASVELNDNLEIVTNINEDLKIEMGSLQLEEFEHMLTSMGNWLRVRF